MKMTLVNSIGGIAIGVFCGHAAAYDCTQIQTAVDNRQVAYQAAVTAPAANSFTTDPPLASLNCAATLNSIFNGMSLAGYGTPLGGLVEIPLIPEIINAVANQVRSQADSMACNGINSYKSQITSKIGTLQSSVYGHMPSIPNTF